LHAGSGLFGGNTDVLYPSVYYPCYLGLGRMLESLCHD
jgi:hypothetical protein